MRRAAAAPVRALSGETAAARRKVTAMGLLRMKRLGEKICMVTAHDYPSAAHVGAAGVRRSNPLGEAIDRRVGRIMAADEQRLPGSTAH